MNNTYTTTEPRVSTEPKVSTLVTGIVHDLEELVKQQLALFRAEMLRDGRNIRDASIPLGLGIWGILVGLAGFALMLVHLLQWATDMPLWVCYLIVAVLCVVVGGILAYVGKKQFDSFSPLPEESAQALKENVECLINPK
jgi:uncharacterized membrane protein